MPAKDLLRFFLFVLADWMARLAALVLAPIAALSAHADGRLRFGLRWMETFDALGWNGPLSEPVTKALMVKGYRTWALCRWLWRNKAYTFRQKVLGLPWNQRVIPIKFTGSSIPKKWGYSSMYYLVVSGGRTYFEFEPRIGYGLGYVYLRCGWKLRQTGMFAGITPRTDDWDDFDPGEWDVQDQE